MKGDRWFIPPLLASIICCGIVVLFSASVLRYTQGVFVYPLDDTYIHLAIAQTLAHSHVWGIGPSEFASASSSPGWTLLLCAADLLVGVRVLTPLVINLALAVALLFAADKAFRSFVPASTTWYRFIVLLVLVFAAPLPNLVFLGMEHVAQALSIFLLCYLAAETLSLDPAAPAPLAYSLVVLSIFSGAIRYEAVFAVGPIIVLLLLRKRFLLACGVALGAASGPAAFALYSHHISGYLLPFSVMAKSSQGSPLLVNLRHPLTVLLGKSSGLPILPPLLLVWIAGFAAATFWHKRQLFLLLSLLVTAEHLVAAPLGWLMRYETYFVFLSLFSLLVAAGASNLLDNPRALVTRNARQLALTLLITFFSLKTVWALAPRVENGLLLPAQASKDRFDEHLQMARFVAAFYDHDAIVLDDIGAVTFYSHAKILDMVGLGSIEPLRFSHTHVGHPFDAAAMEQWASSQGAALAITQPSPPIDKITPRDWKLVQIWKQPRNVVFHDENTAFFATSPAQVNRLCASLAAYTLTRHDQVVFNACPTHVPTTP